MRLQFLFFITLISLVSFSQDFKLLKVDNQAFPLIKLSVSLNERFDINELTVIESGEKKILKIDSVNLYHDRKAICYLIDIDHFNKLEIQNIYKALSKSALELKPNSLINICIVSSANKNRCFIPLSFEFTNRHENFVEFARQISFQNIQKKKSVDFNCTLSQTIDFIYKKEYLPKNKIVIVITKNIKSDKEINQILAADKKKGIAVKLLSNVIDTPFVKHIRFFSLNIELNEKELTNKLTRASLEGELTNINIHNNYVIEFEASQNDLLNKLEIHYHDDIIKTTFLKPTKAKAVGIVWFIIVILILIVGIIMLIKKQTILKSELLSLKETLSLLFDKKMKILSTQTLTPVIEIKLLNDVSNYHIKKIVTSIGRKKDCDVIINNLTISACHANITNEGGEFYIQDNESTNGIFVNDIKISKKLIKNGDIIRMGMAIITIHY